MDVSIRTEDFAFFIVNDGVVQYRGAGGGRGEGSHVFLFRALCHHQACIIIESSCFLCIDAIRSPSHHQFNVCFSTVSFFLYFTSTFSLAFVLLLPLFFCFSCELLLLSLYIIHIVNRALVPCSLVVLVCIFVSSSCFPPLFLFLVRLFLFATLLIGRSVVGSRSVHFPDVAAAEFLV